MIERLGRNLQAQARLARASRASDGDQVVVHQQVLDCGNLSLPPDKGGHLDWQIIGVGNCRRK